MDTFQTLLGLVGGLALFIYGMNLMSEYLQKVAGQRMKRVLEVLTKNAFMGVIAGALCTAVLQSSSATTVMAIGFVSARLMTTRQAVSIILGANIGTTITAQIIAFKITDYVLLFVFIGFLMYFISKKETVKNIGLTIFAFGLLFLGIETMGDAMKPLAKSEFFLNLIQNVADNRFLGLLTGAFMTLIVQSSSATIAVLQNIASTPMPDGVTSVMGLTGALPVLLGDNIGTTITALLASIGQRKEAKRVAVCHCLFNISGALLFIWFIGPYAQLITMISPTGAEVDVISRQIANAHTGFNVIMTCIWLPLIGVLCMLAAKIVPDKAGTDAQGIEIVEMLSKPKHLDMGSIGQPALALQLIAMESVNAAQVLRDGFDEAVEALSKQNGEGLAKARQKVEAGVELINKTSAYQIEMYSKGSLNEDQVAHTAQVMSVLCDEERVGLLALSIIDTLKDDPNSARATMLTASLKHAKGMLDCAVSALEGEKADVDYMLLIKEALLRDGMRIRMEHVKVASGTKGGSAAEWPVNNLLHDIDRMANSCINIAESARGKLDIDYFLSIPGEPGAREEDAAKSE
ncbi:MAG: Na/Pi cotransporter family protein [Coriobacteriales bacterium]